jgi:hypothetical protein
VEEFHGLSDGMLEVKTVGEGTPVGEYIVKLKTYTPGPWTCSTNNWVLVELTQSVTAE